jgi:hypothetical protein
MGLSRPAGCASLTILNVTAARRCHFLEPLPGVRKSHVAGARGDQNRQRVAASTNRFSYIANATRGRTA